MSSWKQDGKFVLKEMRRLAKAQEKISADTSTIKDTVTTQYHNLDTRVVKTEQRVGLLSLVFGFLGAGIIAGLRKLLNMG